MKNPYTIPTLIQNLCELLETFGDSGSVNIQDYSDTHPLNLLYDVNCEPSEDGFILTHADKSTSFKITITPLQES